MSRFKASITYKVKETHPDIKYIDNPKERLTFEDVYTFKENYNKNDVAGYIKNDLSLIAGGGYDDKHIDILSFSIEKIG